MEHELKTWPPFYEMVVLGKKRFELRENDRDFKVGDTLNLREWSPVTKEYTGREILAKVDYVLHSFIGEQFGLRKNYCIMSITPMIEY